MTSYLPYTLTLQAPMAVSDSRAVVEGTKLRAIVADRTSGDERHRLCFSGRVRFLEATPAAEDGLRGLPLPHTWREDPDTHDLWDLFLQGPPTTKTRPVVGHATLQRGDVVITEPTLLTRTRHQRDRDMGRPTAQGGGLFENRFVPAGAVLAGLVAADGDDAEELLTQVRGILGQRPLMLGRARRAGFGGLPLLTFDPVRAEEVPPGGYIPDRDEGPSPRLLLISPHVGRDPRTGEVGPAALAGEVEDALGVGVRRVGGGELALAGWNRTWQCHPPVEVAAAPGTVVELSQPPGPERLDAARHAGLGLRRTEGYGRFVVLSPRHPASLTVPGRPATLVGSPAPGGALDAMTELLEARLVRAAVSQFALDQARAAVSQAGRLPTRSLLGRLRSGLEHGDLALLRAWIEDEGDTGLKRPARDQLRRARIGHQSLDAWLRTQLRPRAHAAALEDRASQCTLVDEGRTRALLRGHSDEAAAAVVAQVLAGLADKGRRQERQQDAETATREP